MHLGALGKIIPPLPWVRVRVSSKGREGGCVPRTLEWSSIPTSTSYNVPHWQNIMWGRGWTGGGGGRCRNCSMEGRVLRNFWSELLTYLRPRLQLKTRGLPSSFWNVVLKLRVAYVSSVCLCNVGRRYCVPIPQKTFSWYANALDKRGTEARHSNRGSLTLKPEACHSNRCTRIPNWGLPLKVIVFCRGGEPDLVVSSLKSRIKDLVSDLALRSVQHMTKWPRIGLVFLLFVCFPR